MHILVTFSTSSSFQVRTKENSCCDHVLAENTSCDEQFNVSSIFKQGRRQIVLMEEGRLSICECYFPCMWHYEETDFWLKFVLSWCYSAAIDNAQGTALSRSWITAPSTSLLQMYRTEGKKPTPIKEKKCEMGTWIVKSVTCPKLKH